MSSIIDRRAEKNKSTPNRKKFLDRYKETIKKAVQKASGGKSLKELEDGGHEVEIDIADTTSPPLSKDRKTGTTKQVLSGNDSFQTGDTINQDKDSDGGDGSSTGEDGEGEFTFTLSKEEFYDIYFGDLALPDFIKKSLFTNEKPTYQRAGFTLEGIQPRLDLAKSMKNSIARRIGAKAARDRDIHKLKEELLAIDFKHEETEEDTDLAATLQKKISVLDKKHSLYLDDVDLRYRRYDPIPRPECKALIYFVMDVSGSMTDDMRQVAKRFFFLMLLFLRHEYSHVKPVFISYTNTAEIVDEETFFYGNRTGGTSMMAPHELMIKDIQLYNQNEWNIYIAHACDSGDPMGSHNSFINTYLHNIIFKGLLNSIQYYAYLHIDESYRGNLLSASNSIFIAYERWAQSSPKLGVASSLDIDGAYAALRKLFAKKIKPLSRS